jgi:signal transduction histidine kinase
MGERTMNDMNWQERSLSERVRWLRYVLPPLLVIIVVVYQLGITQTLAANYGHLVHYSLEIAFYSLTGPVVTWLMLVWVERNLGQQERLEQQVRAAEQERVAVLAEERARIARDLHDGVAQTLYFLALKTDLLRQQFAENDTIVSELREMGQTTRKTIREIRRTIFALRPLDWSETGFIPGLESFIRGFAEQTSWQTAVHIDKTLAIPSRLEPTIFRLIQESMNNVAKHSEANKVTVSLFATRPTGLKLTVEDNGLGFLATTANNRGLGLKQMEARVTAVGGTFHIASEPDSGTLVTAVFPTNGDSHG